MEGYNSVMDSTSTSSTTTTTTTVPLTTTTTTTVAKSNPSITSRGLSFSVKKTPTFFYNAIEGEIGSLDFRVKKTSFFTMQLKEKLEV